MFLKASDLAVKWCLAGQQLYRYGKAALHFYHFVRSGEFIVENSLVRLGWHRIFIQADAQNSRECICDEKGQRQQILAASGRHLSIALPYTQRRGLLLLLTS